jgi:hypothetical protein
LNEIHKPVDHVIQKLFVIPNKQGEIVPFKLNNIQQHFHDNRELRQDILKFRQGGVTSFIMAWFLIECMRKYTRAVMVAHDKESTEKLLRRGNFLLDNMNGLKPKIGRANEQEIFFPKTNASFTIGTAGSKNFGRSDTITHLHCSETAFWKDPKTTIAGLFQAVPHETGVIVKESTANGYGTFHHTEYTKALEGMSRFISFFYPWHIFKEYRSRTPLSSPLTEEEEHLKEKFNLDDAQLQWRREKIEELEEIAIFQQEYPLTVEEAFRVSGGSYFPNIEVTQSETWIDTKCTFGPGKVSYLQPHPLPGFTYILGADSSGGTGNDYSSIQIICLDTLEQVLAYRTNIVPPPDFADIIYQFYLQYNKAYLVPEQNQHGLSVITCLRNHGVFGDLYIMKKMAKEINPVHVASSFGFKTTQVSKYKLIGDLQKTLQTLTLYDTATANQLRGFGEDQAGKLGNIGASNDDDVIALALACEGLRRKLVYHPGIPIPQKKAANRGFIVTLEDIRGRIKTTQKGHPIIRHLKMGANR